MVLTSPYLCTEALVFVLIGMRLIILPQSRCRGKEYGGEMMKGLCGQKVGNIFGMAGPHLQLDPDSGPSNAQRAAFRSENEKEDIVAF